MDIFKEYISHASEDKPTFSNFFMSAHDLKQSLGVKGYLLDHYISMCFNLIA